MTDAQLLVLLKYNLEMISTSFDNYLTHLIDVAKLEIAQEGITLSLSDVLDCNLVVMYAAYLFQKRKTNEPMSRMLRYALNNRLFKEKMEDES